jgi:serine/threonine-protein kinase
MSPLLRQLFHELAGLSLEDRERIFIERGIAPDVRAEVESLLDFDTPNTRALAGSVSHVAEQVLASHETQHGHCGPYRLVRLIGRGGMGAVYFAERTDGEIRQEVAVSCFGWTRNGPPGAGGLCRSASCSPISIIHP